MLERNKYQRWELGNGAGDHRTEMVTVRDGSWKGTEDY
jgi:hypothetical protein